MPKRSAPSPACLGPLTAGQLPLKTWELLSGQWRDIRLVYHSVSGEVGEEVVAKGHTTGVIKSLQHRCVVLGNPFSNRKSFDGELESLHLQAM